MMDHSGPQCVTFTHALYSPPTRDATVYVLNVSSSRYFLEIQRVGRGYPLLVNVYANYVTVHLCLFTVTLLSILSVANEGKWPRMFEFM